MFTCPNCGAALVRVRTDAGMHWDCPSCRGRLVGVAPLRKMLTRQTVNDIWACAREHRGTPRRKCPACDRLMLEARPNARKETPFLDVCGRCHLVWFDAAEFEVLPQLCRESEVEKKEESDRVRQAGAMLQVELLKERSLSEDVEPDEWWKYLPALFGYPVECRGHEVYQRAWATWTVTLLVVLCSVTAMLVDLDKAVTTFGLVPALSGRYGGLTFATSFFLHGGVLHLVGNLYFFLIFGDNVEAYLGRATFLLFLACATLAGGLAHVMADPQSQIPCVGASGGISGVIAFYALRFPHIRLSFLLRWFIVGKWVQMPAYMAFIIWVLFQFVGAHAQIAGISNVSAMAHLGGAATGVVFWLGFRKK